MHGQRAAAAPFAGLLHRVRDNPGMERDHETLVLCCLLWAREGRAAELTGYEDRVLAIVGEHGGRVRQRAIASGEGGLPHEVQLIEFATGTGLDNFLRDPRRLALAEERDRTVARTELFPVTLR